MLKKLHQNQPGISRMKALSRRHIWFPNTDHKLENIVKSYQNCEKVSNEPKKSQPHPLDWSTKPMYRVNLDYLKYNKNNFLIMVDSYSEWLDVEIVRHCDTKNTILCLRIFSILYSSKINLR